MRNKKPQEEPHDHERWLVSYADFITLLFAFFVVMYSVSSVNEGKYKVLSETLEGVFNAAQRSISPIQIGQQTSAPPKSDVPVVQPFDTPDRTKGTATGEEVRRIREIADRFTTSLQKLVGEGLVTINVNDQWIELSMHNSVLFGSGEAVPVDQAFPLIDKIAGVLKDYPNAIVVEGFTDNIPIRSTAYPSNWELSAARSAAVVRLLAFGGVHPRRMAAVGYGEHQPIARNDTAEGRQRNRRVVLLVAKDEKVRLTLRK
jgi:chemotaxis protein MotB